ncbi:MAG: peptidylprolyl isomerase [Beijerinckiaceae bacterium]|jgi:peptidyl-prolyl cis-trans isomerase C|nr:peptidylprolyl isomerase [Beijerinckiaceae bacterium]
MIRSGLRRFSAPQGRGSLFALLAGVAICASLIGSAALAQDSKVDNKVVAKIDGIEITEQEIVLAGEDLGERITQVPAAQRRDYLIGYLADLKIGARAAERAKIGEAPEFALRMAYFRQKVLMDEFISRQSRAAASPEAARKLYDDTMKTMKPEEEVRARHILVEKEDEAKAALARVRKGEDFAKVAAELSRDPGSGKEGGDLGYFTQDRMVPQFGAMAFQIKPGEISEPVQTQFGWHVIKVEDKRAKPLPKFEDVKGEIETYLVRKAQQDIVMGLRGDLKLERLDQPKP